MIGRPAAPARGAAIAAAGADGISQRPAFSSFGPTAALLAALFAAAPVRAADEPPGLDIGHSAYVLNMVAGQFGEAPPKRLQIDDEIVFQEDITTGAGARTIIEFRDGSTFEIGPNAVIRIDAFVFNPEESTSHKTVSVVRGVFRYVSGFVASDQDTRIAVPSGTLGIRGSVAAGIVDPGVPVFLHVAQGSATFANDAGISEVAAGQSIAAPSRATRPMNPAAMPPAVAAEALQAIERRLPPAAVLNSRPAASDALLRREAAANSLPAAEQARLQRAAAPSRLVARPAAPAPIARELTLLTGAQSHGLFDGARTARTVEQQAFLARAERADPMARAAIGRSDAAAGALHSANTAAATATVMRGAAAAAPSVDALSRVAAAAARANPAAAGIITKSALAAYRGPDRRRAPERLGLALEHPGRPVEQTAKANAPVPQRAGHTAERRATPQHPAETGAGAKAIAPHAAGRTAATAKEKAKKQEQEKRRHPPENQPAPPQ